VVKVRTITRIRITNSSNQKNIREKRYMEQGADLQEKYCSIKEKEYELNKEKRDNFILVGYLRHLRL
jgi:hypothetical protein